MAFAFGPLLPVEGPAALVVGDAAEGRVVQDAGGDNSDIGYFEAQEVLNSAPQAKDDAYEVNEENTLTARRRRRA
jgi:hypothetical protein